MLIYEHMRMLLRDIILFSFFICILWPFAMSSIVGYLFGYFGKIIFRWTIQTSYTCSQIQVKPSWYVRDLIMKRNIWWLSSRNFNQTRIFLLYHVIFFLSIYVKLYRNGVIYCHCTNHITSPALVALVLYVFTGKGLCS